MYTKRAMHLPSVACLTNNVWSTWHWTLSLLLSTLVNLSNHARGHCFRLYKDFLSLHTLLAMISFSNPGGISCRHLPWGLHLGMHFFTSSWNSGQCWYTTRDKRIKLCSQLSKGFLEGIYSMKGASNLSTLPYALCFIKNIHLYPTLCLSEGRVVIVHFFQSGCFPFKNL